MGIKLISPVFIFPNVTRRVFTMHTTARLAKMLIIARTLVFPDLAQAVPVSGD